MEKRFNIIIINNNRIDSFLKNFNKRIINFDKKLDFLTLLDCSLGDVDIKKFQIFSKRNKIRYQLIKRNSNGLDQGARLEFFTQIIKNKKLHSKFIFSIQDNYFETELKNYADGSQNFDIVNNKKILRFDNLNASAQFDLKKINKLFIVKKIDVAFYQNTKSCYFEINNNKFIAPHGSNFVIKSRVLFYQKNQILLNLMLNETKFFGPNFSRKLISERGEKWVLWLEYTWGIFFFSERNKIFDLKKNKLIGRFKKANYTDVSKQYLYLYKRFVEFNEVKYVDRQKSKFIYYLKLIKQTFLLLLRGFTT